VNSPAVLILAGLDPSGGAGLIADAQAVRDLGARPLCVPTALTVQSRSRARSFEPVSPSYLSEAVRALLEEEEIHAVKIGMLASPEIAAAVAKLLGDPRLANVPVVLDPVLAASSGAALFRGAHDSIAEARDAIHSLWATALLTPNALEAQLLLGLAEAPRSEEALERAGRQLVAAGAHAVLIKGGHASGAEAVDLLVERAVARAGDVLHANENGLHANQSAHPLRVARFAGPRLFSEDGATWPQLEARGTGCRFASALATGLALGKSASGAAAEAKAYVARYLRTAL